MRRTDQRRAAIVSLYQGDVLGRAPTGRYASAFTRELVEGVGERCEELDMLIERHAIGWKLDRIAPLELSILRVALHELLDRPDVPAEVAIDEAIESAKELCGADAPPFVNGMLAAVHRAQEAPAG